MERRMAQAADLAMQLAFVEQSNIDITATILEDPAYWQIVAEGAWAAVPFAQDLATERWFEQQSWWMKTKIRTGWSEVPAWPGNTAALIAAGTVVAIGGAVWLGARWNQATRQAEYVVAATKALADTPRLSPTTSDYLADSLAGCGLSKRQIQAALDAPMSSVARVGRDSLGAEFANSAFLTALYAAYRDCPLDDNAGSGIDERARAIARQLGLDTAAVEQSIRSSSPTGILHIIRMAEFSAYATSVINVSQATTSALASTFEELSIHRRALAADAAQRWDRSLNVMKFAGTVGFTIVNPSAIGDAAVVGTYLLASAASHDEDENARITNTFQDLIDADPHLGKERAEKLHRTIEITSGALGAASVGRPPPAVEVAQEGRRPAGVTDSVGMVCPHCGSPIERSRFEENPNSAVDACRACWRTYRITIDDAGERRLTRA